MTKRQKRTDTFEQRFPPDQVPMPPGGEQGPRQAPIPRLRRSLPPINSAQDQSLVKRRSKTRLRDDSKPRSSLRLLVCLASPARNAPQSRVVVAPRSFLDAGTEVLPGERKFLDYALPPLHTPTDVVTNTGGRVGWHRSPLPGPFFPGSAPW